MALVKQSVKNLIAGISQQPQILRFPEQLCEQKNGMSSGAEGLKKRPPTLHVATLPNIPFLPVRSDGKSVDPLVHVIERDDTEEYMVLFNGTDVYVWDTDGNQKTVNYVGNARSYLSSTMPREQFKVTTIADYTFVANSLVTVQMSGVPITDVWANQGVLFNVKSGQYGRTYSCFIDDVQVATFSTPDGSTAAMTAQIDTNYIASRLASSLIAGYTLVASGEGWLYIKKNSGSISTAATKDGFNNLAMFSFLRATQKFSNLPATAPDGFTVLVKGDSSSNTDDYYVSYSKAAGLWKECAKPGILEGFNYDTLPHVLVRQSNGTFTFSSTTWDDREVGDDDSNPQPSFVGKTINDIFFIRNRLGFLAGENTILSKAGEFFKFWMTTATDVLDSDTIDDAVPDESVAILRHAVTFNEELLLFSSHAQFIGQSDSIFSPKNFRIDRTTKFDCLPNCRPVPAGRRIYFANARAEYSSLMEYYIVEDVTSVKDAHDISSHVPSLLPNTVHKILGSTSENLLLMLSTGAPNRIYVYKYLWQEEERVQASWSYWELDSGEILGGGFIGSVLYLIVRRNERLFLEKMLFTYDTLDYAVEPYRAYMDRKTVYTVPSNAYNSVTDTTTITPSLVYNSTTLPQGSVYGVIASDGYYTQFPGISPTVSLRGNLAGQQVIVGELMYFKAVPSEIMIKTDDGKGGVKANNKGVLQLRSFWLNYSESGYFKVTVSHKGKGDFSYEMTARTLGALENTIGSLPVSTGIFTFPVQGDSRDVTIIIESSVPSPISLIGYGWEGNHVERSGR
jgi:hypothetical protein